MGLLVLDETRFEQYHESLTQLLTKHEGEFCYDLNVPGRLLSTGNSNINRVIAMRFSSKEGMERFFSDREYKMNRGRHVLRAFASGEIVFGYETPTRRYCDDSDTL